MFELAQVEAWEEYLDIGLPGWRDDEKLRVAVAEARRRLGGEPYRRRHALPPPGLYSPLVRGAEWLVPALFLVGGCCVSDCSGCGSVDTAPGSVPLTLSDFRDLEREGCVVAIEHHEEPPPTRDAPWNCGHAGAICLLLLPFAILPEAPVVADVGTLTCDGQDAMSARYGSSGELVRARIRDGDEVTYVAQIDLRILEHRSEDAIPRHVVVARSRVDVSGEEHDITPVSLQESFDLAGAYRAAMIDGCNPRDVQNCQRSLALELIRAAPSEVPAVARTWAADLPAAQAPLAALVSSACATEASSRRGILGRDARAALLSALPSPSPDDVVSETLACFGLMVDPDDVDDPEIVRRLFADVVRRGCGGEQGIPYLPAGGLEALRPVVPETCDEAYRSTQLRDLSAP